MGAEPEGDTRLAAPIAKIVATFAAGPGKVGDLVVFHSGIGQGCRDDLIALEVGERIGRNS